ncbi:hypothetical protein BH23GEM9_BH23GEM9_31610 [soil metagenome]
MSVTVWILVITAAVLLFLVAQLIYLSVVIMTTEQKTNGLGYYGLPAADRAEFKASLRRHARLLYPLLRLIGRFSKFTFEKATFHHDGIAGPRGSCSGESFARAVEYAPRREDVFVVTQMKCGTTWMQHVVYEVLMRGRGELVEAGTTLYSVAPWLESLKGVPVHEAPLHGSERPSRIIKTHLPAQLCPFSTDARYVYVARHPVSCFASCVDFIATNVGTMAPPLPVVEEWFRSDLMWWGSWPDHVSGWWQRGSTESNVLFVHFEAMKRDLPAVVAQLADFLEITPLTEQEVAQVVEKCSFGYMQRHADLFEMNPPHLLQTDAELFVRGTADRHGDVPPEVKDRILEWCATRLSVTGPAEAWPDLAEARLLSGSRH